MTAVFFSVVSGLVTALVCMYYAGKKWKKGMVEKHKQELAKAGLVYDTPQTPTRSDPDLGLERNVCYGKHSHTSTKGELDFELEGTVCSGKHSPHHEM